MRKRIFRKKSLDRMKSPDNLDDYIRVSNPGVWLLLVCVIVLLAGACIWGAFGHIDSIVPVTVQVDNGSAVCYIDEENIVGIKPDMTVKFEGNEAAIAKSGKKEQGKYAFGLAGEFTLPDGFYKGNIVTKSFKPLAFIFN